MNPGAIIGQTRQKTVIELKRSTTHQVLVSADGKQVILHHRDSENKSRVEIWDIATKKTAGTYESTAVSYSPLLVLSPDGKTLVAGYHTSKDNQFIMAAEVIDLKAKKQLRTITFDARPEGALGVLLHDNKTLAVNSPKGLSLYDITTGKRTQELKSPHLAASSVALSADGKVLACGHTGVPAITLWDATTKKQTRTIFVKIPNADQRKDKGLHHVALSHDGKLVAAHTSNNEVHVYDTKTGKEERRLDTSAFRTRAHRIAHLGFAGKTGVLVITTAGLDPAVFCLDVETGGFGGKLSLFAERAPGKKFTSYNYRTAALSPDGKVLVTPSWKEIHFWDIPASVKKKK